MVHLSSLIAASLAATVSVSGFPLSARQAKPFTLQNGKDAQALNAKFATLNKDSSCTAGDNACLDGGFAQCVNGKFAEIGCSSGLKCFALPLVNKAGTTIACTTEQDAKARISATGAANGITGGNNVQDASPKPAPAPTPAPAPKPAPPPPAPAPPAGAKPFTLQNGKDAQALNAKFSTLNANSPCKAGDQACVGGGFAQCVGGKFAVTQCAGGTKCFALPLVNKAGTSITCSTDADAQTRIAATGATGGITGGGNPPPPPPNANDQSTNDKTAPPPPAPAPAPPANAKPFTLQNGKDAQALNAKFATLSANSSCSNGEQACVNGGFAQCVGGKFAVTQCAGGTKCFALPLVNKAGTSITCSTDADASARIANTGATGGIKG